MRKPRKAKTLIYLTSYEGTHVNLQTDETIKTGASKSVIQNTAPGKRHTAGKIILCRKQTEHY
jgi:hypothetical protein